MKLTLLIIKTLFVALLFVCVGTVNVAFSQSGILDSYIEEGFRNNLVLQQKNVSLDKATLALKEAKSLYLPNIDVQGSYTTATGGRSIQLPLGDLMNPVYATLNQLTQSNNFPFLENQSIDFLPKNYYDVHVRASVPILNTDLSFNKQINAQQIALKDFEVTIYKQELTKNIKHAYYNYLKAQKALSIYRSALDLAEESKRVNERLLAAGKGLPAYVLRSNSEIEQVEAELTQATQNVENSRLYFNALLNRNQAAAIDTLYNADLALSAAKQLLVTATDVSDREEIKSLEKLVDIHENMISMNKKFSVPKVNGFIDLGSQAEDLRFNKQSRYAMLGVQMNMPLFNGNRNRFKIQQSMLDLKDSQLNLEWSKTQLTLSAQVAQNNLRSVYKKYESSLKQLESASAYQRLIDKGYKAGTHTYIETIDARNQLTAARLSSLVNKYQVLTAAADLEREISKPKTSL